ncbi:superinfection immunity protein [Colwellia sp. PAMC 21821]|uniref:superinfection immunity protein n=1 Tax=Colwellia sp. PAMC 21821 TaxID=1816219 RepID=UPI0009BE89C1|nr:superinfection immunity protein [Colwellia sp. PAMC 21821]
MELITFLLIPILYFLPSIVAYDKKHPQANAIVIVNLFLGWTFLGWVVAFIWVFIESKKDGNDYNATLNTDAFTSHQLKVEEEAESKKWEIAKEYKKEVKNALNEIVLNVDKRSHNLAEYYLKDVFLNLGENQIDSHVINTIIQKIKDEEDIKKRESELALIELKKQVKDKEILSTKEVSNEISNQ